MMIVLIIISGLAALGFSVYLLIDGFIDRDMNTLLGGLAFSLICAVIFSVAKQESSK